MYVFTTHVYNIHRRGITSLGNRVTNHFESSQGTWELNSDALGEQVFLTIESFFQLLSVETRTHCVAQTGFEFVIFLSLFLKCQHSSKFVPTMTCFRNTISSQDYLSIFNPTGPSFWDYIVYYMWSQEKDVFKSMYKHGFAPFNLLLWWLLVE